ncbi:MAG: glycoside hydrolase family 5 protein [Halococcoides sp.]
MTRPTPTDDRSTASTGTSRRTFLKTAAGGAALASGLAAGTLGTASAGIPTPWLHVEENTLADPSDSTVKLRGLNIADPKRLNVTAPARGKDASQVIDLVTDPDRGWHPRVVRVPCQPVDIGENTPGHIDGAPEPPAYTESDLDDFLETHLDPVIDQLEDAGVYAIVDMHRHWKPLEWADGVPTAQDDPKDMINQDLHEEVMMFWETVGPRYADRSHVIYEIYNEPTEPGMWADVLDRDWPKYVWDAWQAMAQPWVDTIRADADNHIIVGNPGWSTSPEGALYEPFDGGNLSYAYHIYPGHNASMDQDWDEVSTNAQGTAGDGTPVYEEFPLFVTEFGWDNTIVSNYLRGSTTDFGEPFMEFLESEPAINWTAWVADPVWLPKMFELGDWAGEDGFEDSVGHPYEDEIPELCEDRPCEWKLMSGENMGAFIKEALADRKDDQIPGEDGETSTEESSTSTETTTSESERETPAWPEGATDPNDDGLYEDLSGNGEIDFPDVNALFQNSDASEMDDNAEFYDFEPGDGITLQDVMALFQMV